MKPFRFGVSASTGASRSAWQDLARRVEDLGFSTLVVADHVGELLSPMPAMVSAAEATTSLRVGTLVLDNDVRPAALLAQETATVDLLTDGRLELGLGAGWNVADYEALDIPFEGPGVRVGRLEATVGVLRARAPSVPLLVAGSGRRILTLAARSADIVGLSGLDTPTEGGVRTGRSFTPAGLDETVAFVRSAAGERYESLELNALVQAVVPSADRLDPDLPGDSPFVLVGDTSAIVDALLERRERFGISYYVAFAGRGALGGLGPVVARLAGQ